MRKKRSYEHTCRCGAYKFPHRFGGGRCSGRWLATQGWNTNWGGGDCSNCNNINETEVAPYCEVVAGQESVNNCPIWQEFVQNNDIRTYK